MPNPFRSLAGSFSLFVSVIVLFLLAALGSSLMQEAPKVRLLDYVEIEPSPNDVILGWPELGQNSGYNSAEKEHIRLRYDANEGWFLQNIAVEKKVDAQTDLMDTRYLRRLALQAGDKLHIEDETLKVQRADRDNLTLFNLNTQETAVWTGTRLKINGEVGYNACERSGLRRIAGQAFDWLEWTVLRHSIKSQEILTLFSLGGQVKCTTRFPIADLPADSFRIYWQHGQFWIGSSENNNSLFIERGGDRQELKSLWLQLKGTDGIVNRLILGRTHYQVSQHDQRLRLMPLANQTVFAEHSADEDPAEIARLQAEALALKESMASRGIHAVYREHAWVGQSQIADPWRNSSVLLLAIILSGSLVLAWGFFTLSRGLGKKINLPVTLVLAGVTAISIWAAYAWRGDLEHALRILWMSSIWSSFVLTVRGRLARYAGWLWPLALILAGIGALVLSQLAAGAENTRWFRYAANNIFWLTILFSSLALWSLAPTELINALWIFITRGRSVAARIVRTTTVSVVVFFLLMQFAVGAEEGIWGIQPVEVAKLFMIFIAAGALWHVYMVRAVYSLDYRSNQKTRILWFLWVVIVFILLSLIIAVGVHDYSPTLIVLAVIAAYLWRAMPHPIIKNSWQPWLWRFVLILIPVGFMVAIGAYFFQDPPGYDSAIPQAERLRIWSNPQLYPEAASQLLKSLESIRAAGWFGTDWFGHNGPVMTVPAVQDDFIAAFLLNRFGGIAGFILIFVQAVWLLVLFALSRRLQPSEGYSDGRAAHAILGHILFGLAWIHLVHWAISWGNVLGLFPIMGQPMTWLSAGNSHLLAIAIMTLVLGMFGAWFERARGY